MTVSIYIEMLILATCFGVTLAAVWRLNKTEQENRRLRQDNQMLQHALKFATHNIDN